MTQSNHHKHASFLWATVECSYLITKRYSVLYTSVIAHTLSALVKLVWLGIVFNAHVVFVCLWYNLVWNEMERLE